MSVNFSLGSGSSVSGTAGAWAGSTFYSTTGATSVVGTNGATFYITGVQLEVGTQATSFEYRQYGTELSLCQRYFAKLNNDGTGGDIQLGFGIQQSTTSGQIYIKYPTTMRAEPTASISSLQVTNLRSFSANATLSSISPGFDTANLAVSFGANGVTDAPCGLVISNNTAGFLALSSEL
jgi:hypothetical protein